MTDKRHPGLTIERHREVAKELFEMRNKLQTIAVKLGNAYPLRAGVYKHASNACWEIDELRSTLESEMFKEHPTFTHDEVYIYYPGNDPTPRPGKEPQP